MQHRGDQDTSCSDRNGLAVDALIVPAANVDDAPRAPCPATESDPDPSWQVI